MIYKPKEKNVQKLKTFLKKTENNKTKKINNGNSI